MYHLSDFEAELRGGTLVFFFEHPVKIREVFKSGFHSDAAYAVLGRSEKPCRHGKAVIIQIPSKRDIHIFFEKFHKMRFAESADSGGVGNGYFFLIAVFYIF